MLKKLWRIFLSLFLILITFGWSVAVPQEVKAATPDNWIVYGGTGTGNWSNNNHWSLGAPPTSAQDAVF